MLTFLPYPDFAKSAAALDRQRLGRQRVEARQILEAVGCRLETELGVSFTRMRDDLPDKGPWVERWRRSPAIKMWQGYPEALAFYYNNMVREWLVRGYRNSMPLVWLDGSFAMPPWLGDKEFHAAQRANLIRKDPVFYGQYGWSEKPREGYIWPVR